MIKKLLKILKIVTAILFLFVLMPNHYFDVMPVGLMLLFGTLMSLPYSIGYFLLYGMISLSDIYLFASAIKNYQSKKNTVITILIILTLNIFLSIQYKTMFKSRELYIILPTIIFSMVSISTIILTIVQSKKINAFSPKQLYF